MSRTGHNAERRLKRLLEEQGWMVIRAAGSLGDADLVALRAGHTPMLIEVKANQGSPYMHFGHRDRADLMEAAQLAGGEAYLVHMVPRKVPRWIHASEWPERVLA